MAAPEQKPQPRVSLNTIIEEWSIDPNYDEKQNIYSLTQEEQPIQSLNETPGDRGRNRDESEDHL